MKKIIFVLFFVTAGFQIIAQKILINGKETSRNLTWKDFKGVPDNTNTFWAFTTWGLKSNYRTQINGDSVLITNYELVLQLNTDKSWVKEGKQSDYLLAHEQGHFNIGVICMKEILKKKDESTFTKSNYKTVLSDIFREKMDKFREMGKLYDKETDHSKNKEAQEKWNQYFRENLSD